MGKIGVDRTAWSTHSAQLERLHPLAFDLVSITYSTWREIVAWLSRVMWVPIAARGGVEEVMKDSFFSGVDWKVPFNKLIV